MVKGAVTLMALLLTPIILGARIIRKDSITYNQTKISSPQNHIHHLNENLKSVFNTVRGFALLLMIELMIISLFLFI